MKWTTMPGLAVIIIAVIAVAAIVVYLVAGNSGAQTVAVGDTVEVYYTGKFTNGTVFDSNAGKETLNFTVGSGQMISGFDNAVIGMKVGENKTVTLPPDEAYGAVNSNLIIAVPISQFGNQSVKVGMAVTSTSQSGQQAQGVVTAVDSNTATVDFNPPMAGKTLVFTIEVVGIQKSK